MQSSSGIALLVGSDLIGCADEDETCEECDLAYEVLIFDGWLALCRECTERDVAPDHAAA